MKKLFTFVAFLVLVCLSSQSMANVFASGIKISNPDVTDYALANNTWDNNFADGSGIKIWYIVNENGGTTLSATINVYDGVTKVASLKAGAPVKGVNSYVWTGWDNAGQPVPAGKYTFDIMVSDGIGHTSFDSLWVAGAFYQNGGKDLDNGTSFAYRGTASVKDHSSNAFGRVYVGRGTSSGTNGIYELRADGVYMQKIATTPAWASSTPDDLFSIGGMIYATEGFGYGAGVAKAYVAETGEYKGTAQFGSISVRGLAVQIAGNDTIYYTGRTGVGAIPAIIKKTGVNGDTATVINMRPYITGDGYIKSIVFDDEGNMYVAFGEASATRKSIAKFSSTGQLVFNKKLDTDFTLPATAYFNSLTIYNGDPSTANDDKLYALVYGGSSTAVESGIYSVQQDGSGISKLISLVGVNTGATSQMLGTDAAGNVIWSDGGTKERIIAFSPAGQNMYTTKNPAGTVITILNPVPVELTSFMAKAQGKNVELSWTTATEKNNNGFEIERKSGNSWMKVGFVKGNGTMSEVSSYSFVDKNVSVNGKVVYRLKQVDYNGAYSYSSEVEVNLLPGEFALKQNYPNPFNPSTTISYVLPKDTKVVLSVYSINGELVQTLVNEFQTAGEHSVNFNAAGLASGTYIYRLSTPEQSFVNKMSLIK